MIDKEEQRRRARQLEQDMAAQGQVAPKLPMPPIKGPTDAEGKKFEVGQRVARAMADVSIAICKVTRIEEGRVYLDDSRKPMREPSRLLILK